MKDKRKLAASLTAGGMAAAILLTGTFAWRSISQKGTNEMVGDANPGGRLHDDFDGKNKDIYVENFTSPEDGAPIFARVRLREYMEVGAEAGNPGADGYEAKAVGKTDAQLNDHSTWAIHHLDESQESTDHMTFHDYVTWDQEGGSTVYMPTFNKNKDSLIIDRNGTLEGLDGLYPWEQGDTYDKYQDNKTYTVGNQATGNAIYDADSDDHDDVGDYLAPDGAGVQVLPGGTAVDGVNYNLVEETHEAKKTQDCTVISMEEWKAKDPWDRVGNYWVYDTDGWAYWAAPIMPDTATGLLLDGVSVTQTPDEEWYYAIDVEAQFSTAYDWGTQEKGDGFFDVNNGGMQDDGESVLDMAAKSLNNKITISLNNTAEDIATVDSFVAQPGDKARFSVWARINGQEHQLSMQELGNVTWSVVGNKGTTSISCPYEYTKTLWNETFVYDHNSALLTLDEAIPAGTTLSVSATYQGMTDRIEVQVKNLDYGDLGDVIPGSLTTVTIDNVEWYVLVKNQDQVLLWADDSVQHMLFGSKDPNYIIWKGSDVETYLNGTFWNSLSVLKQDGVVNDTTLTSWDGQGLNQAQNWITTTNKVFLLTDADIAGRCAQSDASLGTNWHMGTRTATIKDYTYQIGGQGQVLVPDMEMRKFNTKPDNGGAMLRGSGGEKCESVLATTCFNGTVGTVYAPDYRLLRAVRPAMWVNLGVEVTP